LPGDELFDDAGGDFGVRAGRINVIGGRFGGAAGFDAEGFSEAGGRVAVLASDMRRAFDTPMRGTAVVVAPDFLVAGFEAATGGRAMRLTGVFAATFLIGAFFAGARAVADFAVVFFAAGRLAAGFLATFFATRATAFLTTFFAAFFTVFFTVFFAADFVAAGRVAAAFFTPFLAAFVAVFFVAFFTAVFRDAAFFIAIPHRSMDRAAQAPGAAS
jgi:hypothetical protein